MRFDNDIFQLVPRYRDLQYRLSSSSQMTCIRLNLIQENLIYYTMAWFGHSFVSE